MCGETDRPVAVAKCGMRTMPLDVRSRASCRKEEKGESRMRPASSGLAWDAPPLPREEA